jgi:hypothetical protein
VSEVHAVRITYEIPPDIEEGLRASGDDLNADARRAYLLSLYRQERISHSRLQDALGVSFHEAEVLIKKHGVGQDFTLEEFEQERAFLRGMLRDPKSKRSGGDKQQRDNRRLGRHALGQDSSVVVPRRTAQSL